MFNATRSSHRGIGSILFCLVGLICGSAGPMASAAAPSTNTPAVQLKPGRALGTFHFARQSRATFTMNGSCELIASFKDVWMDVAASIAVRDPHDFTIEADLRPGTYWISVAPRDANNADYWPSKSSLRIHIDKAGRLYVQDREPSDEADFLVVRRIRGLSPDRLAIAEQARPTLTWPAIPGAVSYQGNLMADGRFDPIHVMQPKFPISRDLPADKLCAWNIIAWGRNRKILAEGRGFFFGKGTKAAVVDEARAEHKSSITQPPPGGSYLGIRVAPGWVNKNPTKLPPDGIFPIPRDSDTDFIPGIEVGEVAPGSPAIDAGLRPDDVIVAMNNHAVLVDPKEGVADVQAFFRQISALAPGSQIKLKVRRFPKEFTVTATLARFSGTKPEAPATAPAGG